MPRSNCRRFITVSAGAAARCRPGSKAKSSASSAERRAHESRVSRQAVGDAVEPFFRIATTIDEEARAWVREFPQTAHGVTF